MDSKIKLTLVFLILGSSLTARAAENPPENPEALAKQGKWSEAVKIWESHPETSSRYFYNLGTASLQGGQTGSGLAYLEKAARLAPSDGDIQANLKIARAQLTQVLGEGKLDPGASGLDRWVESFPVGLLKGLLAAIGAALLAFSFSKPRSWTRIGVGTAALVLALIVAGIQSRGASPGAIAVARTVLHSGPGDQYPQVAQIDAGVRMRLSEADAPLEGNAAWIQVRYAEDLVGWAPRGSLLLL